MSDYTELCARLRRMSDMTTTNNDIRDVLRAADAIESQALEIAELRTWRDEAVRLCAKRNCAGRDRRIRDLEEDNDALRARAEAAEGLLREAMRRAQNHGYICASDHGNVTRLCNCGLNDLRARVAAALGEKP